MLQTSVDDLAAMAEAVHDNGLDADVNAAVLILTVIMLAVDAALAGVGDQLIGIAFVRDLPKQMGAAAEHLIDTLGIAIGAALKEVGHHVIRHGADIELQHLVPIAKGDKPAAAEHLDKHIGQRRTAANKLSVRLGH